MKTTYRATLACGRWISRESSRPFNFGWAVTSASGAVVLESGFSGTEKNAWKAARAAARRYPRRAGLERCQVVPIDTGAPAPAPASSPPLERVVLLTPGQIGLVVDALETAIRTTKDNDKFKHLRHVAAYLRSL